MAADRSDIQIRRELILDWIVELGTVPTIAEVMEKFGIARGTASNDLKWVAAHWDTSHREARWQMLQDKAEELIEERIGKGDMADKDVIAFLKFLRPTKSEVKGEVDVMANLKVEWSPTKPSGG